LGLSLVKAVLHAHHGEIRVSSAPDAGSVFEIRLPAIPPPAHLPNS
jgi:two-component system OmpR family sensor kinase